MGFSAAAPLALAAMNGGDLSIKTTDKATGGSAGLLNGDPISAGIHPLAVGGSETYIKMSIKCPLLAAFGRVA